MPAKKVAKKATVRIPKNNFVTAEDAVSDLANGASKRVETKSVDVYLTVLASQKRGPGRRSTPETVKAQIAKVDEELGSTVGAAHLELVQRRLDLNRRLEELETASSFEELETDFIQHAASYGQRKGITYAAWRECGVAAEVLKRAGIGR